MKFDEKYIDTSYVQSDDKRAIIILKERKENRIYEGHNKNGQRVIVYRVDNGIISSQEIRKCDFAVYTEKGAVYFIELKGTDYDYALEQIISTIDRLIIHPQIVTSAVNARVVLSKMRVPDLRSSNETKLLKLLKRLKGTLDKKSIKLIDIID